MTSDITTRVMNRVKKYERVRVSWWIGKWGLTIVSLVIVAVIILGLAVWEIYDLGTWDLLSELGDNVDIIWAELPKETLGMGIGMMVAVTLLLWLMRAKIRIIVNKLKYLTR